MTTALRATTEFAGQRPAGASQFERFTPSRVAWHLRAAMAPPLQGPITPPSRPTTLDDVLALRGRDFLDAAYRWALSRPADETGVRIFMPLLGSVAGQLDVLQRIVMSAEGQARAQSLGNGLALRPHQVTLRQAGIHADTTALARTVALYRVVLARDPDSEGLLTAYRVITSDGLDSAVRSMLRSPEAKAAGRAGRKGRIRGTIEELASSLAEQALL